MISIAFHLAYLDISITYTVTTVKRRAWRAGKAGQGRTSGSCSPNCFITSKKLPATLYDFAVFLCNIFMGWTNVNYRNNSKHNNALVGGACTVQIVSPFEDAHRVLLQNSLQMKHFKKMQRRG